MWSHCTPLFLSAEQLLSYQQEGKEMLEGRLRQGLWVCACLESWKELHSLFLIPCSGLQYRRHGGESLEGSGRSNNSIWFCLAICIPCSWLPIISPWVCASLLSAPYESVSSFFGVGVTLCSVPRLVYGKGRKRWFSWGQDLSDLVLLLLLEVAGCLFSLRLAGTSLSAGVLISWKQDVEKAAAGGAG